MANMLIPNVVWETAKELIRQVEVGTVGPDLLALQVLKLERATVMSILHSEAKEMKGQAASMVVQSEGGVNMSRGFANAIQAVRELQAFLERHLDARHVVEGVTARVLDAVECKRDDHGGMGLGGGGGAGGGDIRMGMGNSGFPYSVPAGVRIRMIERIWAHSSSTCLKVVWNSLTKCPFVSIREITF